MDTVLTNLESSGVVITAVPEQVSSELGGEAVILNLQSGVYYGLNIVGARIWDLIQQQACTVSELHAILLEEYDVDVETCRQDLLAILNKLREAGLVEAKYVANS